MDKQVITIDGQVYEAINPSNDVRIVILQRGWVAVGRYECNGNDCTLRNAAIIRIWGTTKGLPELVEGPTSKTVLDKCHGCVEFHKLTVIATIRCNVAMWENHLS